MKSTIASEGLTPQPATASHEKYTNLRERVQVPPEAATAANRVIMHTQHYRKLLGKHQFSLGAHLDGKGL